MLESDSRISQRYATEFALFEVISVIIFSIEYVLRVWSCIESQRFNHLPQLKARIRYMTTPVVLIDFIAIAPFYISPFIAIDLRYLRLLRVLRLLKLIHYFKRFNIFLAVIAKEFKSMVAAIWTSQGPCYCAVGSHNVECRNLIDEHFDVCVTAGVDVN